MIRVERDEKSEGGKWAWRAIGGAGPVEGRSSQPLLDACLALKRMGEDEAAIVALFRPGRSDWDLRTTVGHGASHTVKEGKLVKRPHAEAE